METNVKHKRTKSRLMTLIFILGITGASVLASFGLLLPNSSAHVHGPDCGHTVESNAASVRQPGDMSKVTIFNITFRSAPFSYDWTSLQRSLRRGDIIDMENDLHSRWLGGLAYECLHQVPTGYERQGWGISPQARMGEAPPPNGNTRKLADERVENAFADLDRLRKRGGAADEGYIKVTGNVANLVMYAHWVDLSQGDGFNTNAANLGTRVVAQTGGSGGSTAPDDTTYIPPADSTIRYCAWNGCGRPADNLGSDGNYYCNMHEENDEIPDVPIVPEPIMITCNYPTHTGEFPATETCPKCPLSCYCGLKIFPKEDCVTVCFVPNVTITLNAGSVNGMDPADCFFESNGSRTMEHTLKKNVQIDGAFFNNLNSISRPINRHGALRDNSNGYGWEHTGYSLTDGMVFTAKWQALPAQDINLVWQTGLGPEDNPPNDVMPEMVNIGVNGMEVSLTLPDLMHPTFVEFKWYDYETGLIGENGLAAGSQIVIPRGLISKYVLTAKWDETKTREYNVILVSDWPDAPANWLTSSLATQQAGGEYTIKVNAQGGEVQGETDLPPETSVARPGWILESWKLITPNVTTTVQMIGGGVFRLKQMASQDVEVMAEWREQDYVVRLNATAGDFPAGTLGAGWEKVGGTSTKIIVFKGTKGTQVTDPLLQPTSLDYTFGEWQDASGTVIFAPGYQIPENGMTFYPVWHEINRDLIFHVNVPAGETLTETGAGAESFIKPYVRGADMLPWINTIESHPNYETTVRFRGYGSDKTIPGYEFVGWSDNPNTLVPHPQISNMPGGTITEVNLYAIWKPRIYKITFHLNGAFDPDSQLSHTDPFVMQVEYKQTINVPTEMLIKRVGYTLKNWHDINLNVNMGFPETGFDWAALNNRMPAYDFEVQAQWEKAPITVEYHTNVSGLNFPSFTGYVHVHTGALETQLVHPDGNRYFVNWYRQNGFLNNDWDAAYLVDRSGFLMPVTNGPVKLYARWTDKPIPPPIPPEKYSFRFDANGGSVNGELHYTLTGLMPGDQITSADVPSDPEQLGFKFLGWFSTRSDSGTPESPVIFPFTIGNENATVYARWETTQFTITYIDPLNDNAVVYTRSAYVNDELTEFDETLPPQAEQYIADGWWTDNGFIDDVLSDNDEDWGGERFDFSVAKMGSANLTLYARYYLLSLEIQYINAGPGEADALGTEPYHKDIISYGETGYIIHDVMTMTRPGMTQIGWGFLSHDAMSVLKRSYDPETANDFSPSDPYGPDNLKYIGDGYHFASGDIAPFWDGGSGLFVLGVDQFITVKAGGLDEYFRLIDVDDPDAVRESYKFDFLTKGRGVLKLFPIWEQVDVIIVSYSLPHTNSSMSQQSYSGPLLRQFETSRELLEAQDGFDLQDADYMNNTGTGDKWADELGRWMLTELKGQPGGYGGGSGAIPGNVVSFREWRLSCDTEKGEIVYSKVINANDGWRITYEQLAPHIGSTDVINIMPVWNTV